MQHSESINDLALALALAQAEMPAAKMNALNPFLKNKFADLGSVIDAARPVLAKHGLAIVQLPTNDGDKVGVETIITHKSGQWMSNTVSLPVGDEKGKSDAQIAGSIITYLRRYSFSAACAMYADEDTDWHKGSEKGKADEPKPRLWTLEQKDAIVKAGHAENVNNAKAMLDLSILPVSAGPAVCVSWAKYYREARNSGKDETLSAATANDIYSKAKKG